MRAETGCLRGAMRVGEVADEPNNLRAFYLRVCNYLDATKVQENGGSGAADTGRGYDSLIV